MAVILIMATLSTLRPGPLCALIVLRYVKIITMDYAIITLYILMLSINRILKLNGT